MSDWHAFLAAAPRIGRIFQRRHAAAGKLCLLATLRSDGYPRISPLEPRVAGGELWLAGMPGTRKFADLDRDPRLSLHTATVDSSVADGDAKIWARAVRITDRAKIAEFAQVLYADTGIDVRDGDPGFVYAADILGASAVEKDADRLTVLSWKQGGVEGAVRQL